MHYIAEWEGQLQRESSINSLLTGRVQSKIHRSLSKKLHARPAQLYRVWGNYNPMATVVKTQ